MCGRIDIEKDEYCLKFLEAYRPVRKRGMVWVENFREDSRQWRMAYDPYQHTQVLQIYGKHPPRSFQIRQKILEEQKNILDRYSHVSPVNEGPTVLN